MGVVGGEYEGPTANKRSQRFACSAGGQAGVKTEGEERGLEGG